MRGVDSADMIAYETAANVVYGIFARKEQLYTVLWWVGRQKWRGKDATLCFKDERDAGRAR
jgi:hypothetical protein